MNEETTTSVRAGRGVSAAWLIGILIVVAVAAYAIIRIALGTAPDPAAYVPGNAVAALCVDVRPTGQKSAAVRRIADAISLAVGKDFEQDLWQKLDKELGLDSRREIATRLNGRAAVAVLPDMIATEPSVVAAVGARSSGAADSLVALVGEQLNSRKLRFNRLKDSSGYVYRIPLGRGALYVGATDCAVVLANSRGGFRKAVEANRSNRNLLKNKDYAKLRKQSGAVFATTYFSGPAYWKLVGPMMAAGAAEAGQGAVESLRKGVESTVAAVGNAEADGEGIRFAAQMISVNELPKYSAHPIARLAACAPEDAAALVCVAGWDKVWAESKRQLLADPQISRQISAGIDASSEMLGFDPFADLLDRITSVSLYYDPARPTNRAGFPGHLCLTLAMGDARSIPKVIGSVHRVVASQRGPQMNPVKVAGVQAMTTSPTDGLRFADALVEDKLLVMMSGSRLSDGLSDAVLAAQGKGSTLADSPRFKIASEMLPEEGNSLLYADVAPVIDRLGVIIAPDNRRIAKSITGTVSMVGMTSRTRGRRTIINLVVPFNR